MNVVCYTLLSLVRRWRTANLVLEQKETANLEVTFEGSSRILLTARILQLPFYSKSTPTYEHSTAQITGS